MFFFFNDTATTEIYTLSLHDALPIFGGGRRRLARSATGLQLSSAPRGRGLSRTAGLTRRGDLHGRRRPGPPRSEEHTSELPSRQYLVCRLLLEKKKNKYRHS